jgi:iron only hydrogenase large subunit-like protein
MAKQTHMSRAWTRYRNGINVMEMHDEMFEACQGGCLNGGQPSSESPCEIGIYAYCRGKYGDGSGLLMIEPSQMKDAYRTFKSSQLSKIA